MVRGPEWLTSPSPAPAPVRAISFGCRRTCASSMSSGGSTTWISPRVWSSVKRPGPSCVPERRRPAAAFTTWANHIVVNPVRIETTTTSVRKDLVFVQELSGQESAWNFSGGALDSRAGHVISRVARKAGEEFVFLMAFNHTTGQFARFDGALARRARLRAAARLDRSDDCRYVRILVGAWNLIPALSQMATARR